MDKWAVIIFAVGLVAVAYIAGALDTANNAHAYYYKMIERECLDAGGEFKLIQFCEHDPHPTHYACYKNGTTIWEFKR